MFSYNKNALENVNRQLSTLLFGPWRVKITTSSAASDENSIHDDVIKSKRFSRNWPFVRGTTDHRWIPLIKGNTGFDDFFAVGLN